LVIYSNKQLFSIFYLFYFILSALHLNKKKMNIYHSSSTAIQIIINFIGMFEFRMSSAEYTPNMVDGPYLEDKTKGFGSLWS